MASRWLSSRWLELTLSVLVAAAEAATFALALRFVAAIAGVGPGAVPSPVGLAIVALVSFWAARTFLEGNWDLGASRGMSLAIWLALILIWFAIKSGTTLTAPWHFVDQLIGGEGAPLLLLLLGGLAWWRGISLAGEPNPFTPDFTRRLVARGVGVAITVLVLAALVGGEAKAATNGSATAALPILLVAGLLAAGAAQIRASGRTSRDALGWLGGAGGSALALFIVAALVAGLAGRSAWRTIIRPLEVVAHGLDVLLIWIVTAIAVVVYVLIIYPILWIVRHLGHAPPQQQQQQQQANPNDLQNMLHQGNSIVPTWVLHLFEAAVVAVVAVLVIRYVLRSLRRYRASGSDEPVEEVHESIWSPELAAAQLRGLLRDLRPHRAPRAHTSELDLAGEPADVREAYRRLLAVGEREGAARQASESAVDYSVRLRGVWSDLRQPLDDLTARYLRARYAEESTGEDVQQARSDWRAIAGRLLNPGKAAGGGRQR